MKGLARSGRRHGRGCERELAVVTGASRGIGRASAVALANEGFQVLAGVRTEADRMRLSALHPALEPFILDVTRETDVDALATRLSERPAGLALLVNNAAIAAVGPIELVKMARWNEVLAVNVTGCAAVSRACLPALFRARGRVINVSSPAGLVAFPMMAPYVASKFALEGFTDALRRECAPGGVAVIAVTPDRAATNLFRSGLADAQSLMSVASRPEYRARYGRQIASAMLAAESVLAAADERQPDAAAAMIVRAALARRPRRRYRQGAANHVAALLSVLPVRLGDPIVKRLTETAFEALPAESGQRGSRGWPVAGCEDGAP